MENLTILHANHTMISNLRPLQDLPKLERIYCDHTLITRTLADAFMATNSEVLVIFDFEDLKGWWETYLTHGRANSPARQSRFEPLQGSVGQSYQYRFITLPVTGNSG